MDIRIISLKSEAKRREHMAKMMEKNRLNYQWFDALNGKQGLAFVSQLGLSEKINTNVLSLGEIGCMMSHISIWYEIVEKHIDWMCIMEDDIHLGENAHHFLNNSEWIPNCDCVKLEKMNKKVTVHIFPIKQLAHKRKAYSLAGCHLGSAGYILSLSGAKKLICYLQNTQFITPIDRVVFEEITNSANFLTLQMQPALCIQDDVLNKHKEKLVSCIEKERREIKERTKTHEARLTLTAQQKFKREMVRLKSQIINFISDLVNKRKTIHLIYK